MTLRYLRLAEVCQRLAIDEHLLHEVCEEGLVEIKQGSEAEAVISSEHAERLRLIAFLMRELDVNLPGVEVILHLRDDLYSRQRQFDEILRAVAAELRQRMAR
jgi:MerR family transcriptional regulator/heat shock protein HspR